MMFTFDLAEIMKPKGVTVNCLDPGTVNTKMLIAGKHSYNNQSTKSMGRPDVTYCTP